jgi:hypothetical protein
MVASNFPGKLLLSTTTVELLDEEEENGKRRREGGSGVEKNAQNPRKPEQIAGPLKVPGLLPLLDSL